MCTVRSLHCSWNSALPTQVLKIHQNAVFYIPTRTRIHLLKSQAKNHATSSFAHKLATFSSSRPSGFFPSHCALLKIFFCNQKCPKNASIFSYTDNLEKLLSGPLPIRFFFLALSKNFNILISQV